MGTYKIIVEYDGTRYRGFRTGKKSNTASIQEKLEAVLLRFESGKTTPYETATFKLVAAVNTEPGVHSMGQTVSYQTEGSYAPEEILTYCNTYLPGDIVVRQVEKVKDGFRADFAKTGLFYQYRIQTGCYRNVREQGYMEYEPDALDVLQMEEGAVLLMETTDLMALNHNRKLKKSTLRSISEIQIQVDRDSLHITCQIDDVWPGLMPAIFGILLEVGKHQLTLKELHDRLLSKELGCLYHPAAVKGLMLMKVLY